MTPSAAENVTSLSCPALALKPASEGAGAQILFDYMLVEAGLKKDQLDLVATCHTELNLFLPSGRTS